jgi:transcriptional regulator with XRE-family HTH domain
MLQRRDPRTPTAEDEALGARIRDRRIRLGLSRPELGKFADVSFQQIQKYEIGKSRIAASRLSRIARVLKTTPNDLLGWNGGQPAVGRRKSTEGSSR